MLAEILTWLATPCPPAARRLGYLGSAIGLASRARRCRRAWAGHLEHSRNAVMQSLARCRQRRTALILGSGLALEYPLDSIAAQFEHVVLADIVHLPAMRRQACRYANVELLSCDLGGLTESLLTFPRSGTVADLDGLVATPPRIEIDDVDWVVSCNLLSQLPLLPTAWLQRRNPQLADAILERWGRSIMSRHLDWLDSFTAERCLVADAEQITHDRRGNILERADLAAAFGLERHAYASWEWEIAPPGELPDGMSARHRVVACRWPAAGAD